MSTHEPDTIEIEDFAEQPAQGDEVVCETKQSRVKRVLKWVAITFFSVIGFVVFAAAMLYFFGGPSGTVYPEVLAQYDQAVAAGQAQPIQKRFVIGIPGCKCHSTDPTLTAQHMRRHMNECMKCHNTDPPHMEPGVL